MTKPSDPYSRVYWRIVDDDRFATVYGTDHHLASWLRLLLIADQAWPASANVPASARASSVKALADCGLIDLRPGGLYRVHGLDAERSRRQDSAATAASHRWSAPDAAGMQAHPIGNAVGDAEGMPRREETRKDEPSLNGREVDALDTYYSLTIRYPVGRPKDWLTELANEFGHSQTSKALAVEWKASSDAKTFLGRTEARLRSDAHHAEMERAKPKPKPQVSAADAARFEEQRKAIMADLMTVKDA